MPLEKPEPNDNLIEPKSEYLEDQEESVEDLTLDDDMNDLNEMEQDNNRAGPSHDPSQHPGKLNELFLIFYLNFYYNVVAKYRVFLQIYLICESIEILYISCEFSIVEHM